MDLQQRPLKLHFIPYVAAGHLIPLCDIATLFASRGQHVTVSTTPSNAHILRESNPSLLNIHIHIVDFPSKEVGLPDGIETMTGVDGLDNSAKLHRAAMLLREPITRFIHQHPPDCIVADFVYPWVDDVANNLRIPRLAFNPSPLFAISAMESVKSHPTLHSETGPFVIPDFPHHITMYARPPKILTEYTEPLLGIQLKSYGLILNNFEELDGEEYVQHYEKTTGHKVWHIGPAFMSRRTAAQERSHKSVVGELECLSWLNSKRLNSVVYICFGSMCHFPDQQLYEMACGIEQAGHNFIWVVPEKKGKEEESEGEKEKWLPKGFEERNKEKGMIIRGWAPQLLILAHSSLGAFLTHCGASSILEGVSAGVPMITWPVQGDHFYNEKLITQVQKIGVEVGVTEWKLIGFGERDKLVGRDSIEKAVKRLMDGRDEAQEIRRRAKEFGEKAKAALRDGGSSHRNLTLLIEDLMWVRDSSK